MVGCTLFKLCHCKCTKAYSLEILGMSGLWHDLMAHGLKCTFCITLTNRAFSKCGFECDGPYPDVTKKKREHV